MHRLDLFPDEFFTVCQACSAVQVCCPAPPYLQDFLAHRLKADAPELAAKVWCFDREEMEALCELIEENQSASRHCLL